MLKKMWQKGGEFIKKHWLTAASIILLLILVDTFPIHVGVGIFLILYLSYILIRVWQAREQVISLKHYIETVIWGKPLKMFDKGELKNTKVKIVWRRDKK